MFKKITDSTASANKCNLMKTEVIQKGEVRLKKQKNKTSFIQITRNILLLLSISINCVCVQSCSNSVKNKGNVTIKNGKNEVVSIPYECSNCERNTIDKQIFATIINEITSTTKNSLLYPLSYIPSNIVLNIYPVSDLKYCINKSNVGDVIAVSSTMYYTAKNGFGNELEGKYDDFFYIRYGFIDRDLLKKIELTPLKIESYGFPNRDFLASNEDYEFIKISPVIKKDGVYLIVKSSLKEGFRVLSFIFSYGEKEYDNDFYLFPDSESINEDKSISYYNLTKETIEILKNSKLASVSIKNSDNSLYCSVDNNLEAYFQEYFSLKEVEQVIQAIK